MNGGNFESSGREACCFDPNPLASLQELPDTIVSFVASAELKNAIKMRDRNSDPVIRHDHFVRPNMQIDSYSAPFDLIIPVNCISRVLGCLVD